MLGVYVHFVTCSMQFVDFLTFVIRILRGVWLCVGFYCSMGRLHEVFVLQLHW